MSEKTETWRCNYGHDHAEQKPSHSVCPAYIEAVVRPGTRAESQIATLVAEAGHKARQAAVEAEAAIHKLLRAQDDGVLIFLHDRRSDDRLVTEEIVRRFAGAKEPE